MRKFHFISGMPRSGSTLLSAILRQNPRFHAGISSPVGGLFEAVLSSFSAGTEMAPMVSDAQRKRLLRGLFDNYYADLPARTEIVFDTGRGWNAKLDALTELFPAAKVICCVRNPAWVLDSLERQFRQNAFDNTRLFNSRNDRSTVYSRVEAMSGRNQIVGFAWSALLEALHSPYSDRLLVIDYDLLTEKPARVMKALYDFIGEEQFEHDFENVEFEARAFDDQLGVDGLHRVRPRVEPNRRQTILPPDLFAKYSQQNLLSGLGGTKATILVSKDMMAQVRAEQSISKSNA